MCEIPILSDLKKKIEFSYSFDSQDTVSPDILQIINCIKGIVLVSHFPIVRCFFCVRAFMLLMTRGDVHSCSDAKQMGAEEQI